LSSSFCGWLLLLLVARRRIRSQSQTSPSRRCLLRAHADASHVTRCWPLVPSPPSSTSRIDVPGQHITLTDSGQAQREQQQQPIRHL